jgi:hypothetical protein
MGPSGQDRVCRHRFDQPDPSPGWAKQTPTVPVRGQKRLMDCIDCHIRAAHSFDTPENALDKEMALGGQSVSLPFVHQQGLAMIKAKHESTEAAGARITSQLASFYRSRYPTVWNSQPPQIGRNLWHKCFPGDERNLGDAPQQHRP